MRKSLLSLCVVLSFLTISNKIAAQTKITDFPTYVGNPAGGWVPIVINGINRKIDASLMGYNQIDSFTIGLGQNFGNDTFYLWKNHAIAFYILYPHNGGGGGGGIGQIGMQVPGGFFVTPTSLTSNGTFNITTNLNGVVHASGGAFSGGQIFNTDVHDVAFSKLTGLPTTKSGYGITDVMAYTDTFSLSNRIVSSVKYTDTASMLTPYLRKKDTSSLSNRINSSVKYTDTSNMLVPYLHRADTGSLSNRINLSVKYTDTATMLAPYLHRADTGSLSTRINLKVNYTDTASMLTPYLHKADTISMNNRIALKVNYTDTSSMLLAYLRKTDTTNMLATYMHKADTNSLSNRINSSVKYTDTSNMLAPYLHKGDTSNMLLPYLRSSTAAVTYYPLSSNPSKYYKPTDTALILATQYYVMQHGSIYTAGYGLGLSSGAFFVDTSTSKIATQYYVNNHSGTTYTAGNGLLLSGTIFKADTSIVGTQYGVGLRVRYIDTTGMLAPYLRSAIAATTYYPLSLNPAHYLTSIDTSNIASFSVKVRGLFAAGAGLTYNAATGTFINSITNNNQLTNGAGYITGINSSQVTTALGYTPVNPTGTTAQYIRGDGSFASYMFNNLTDVTVTSPSNGQLMKYNSGTSKWINFTPTYYQPSDTVSTLATKTNIIKDTVIGFQIGDGGTYTPSNGTATYTNPILQNAQLIGVFKADTLLPTFSITGGTPYVSFNATTGVITLHNTTFLNSQPVVVQYTFGNGIVPGGGGGGGSVSSVFGRSGAVTAQAGDYSSYYYPVPTGTTSQYIRGDGSFSTFPTLATVATTGNYSDLSGKPVIPTNTNQLTNGSGFITGITSSNVIAALGYTPLNPSGSSSQYIEGNGSFATTDTTMIPSFGVKVRGLFTAGSGVSISNGIITNAVTSGQIISALSYTPVNQSNTITINGSTLDLSASRSYTVNYSTLGDVALTSLTDQQLMKYNSTAGKWVNFTPTYLSSVDTGNIPNFYQKVRSLITSGSGISISNGVVTNTINNTNQLINGAGFLSSIDTGNITNFYQKVRSLISVGGGGISYANGVIATDTSGTLATQTYVLQHISGGTITSVAGTTNQIAASTTGSAVTLSLPSNVHISNSLFIGSTGAIQWGDGGIGGVITGYMQAQSNGVFQISNNAANDFGRLELGGPTSSYPAIARNGTGVDIKLADNSAYSSLQASSFIVNGGTSSQYLMANGTSSTITSGTGILFSSGIIKADTTTALTGLTTLYKDGLKVKYTDTVSMLSPYLRSTLGAKYTDTASMLSPYARKTFISGAVPIAYSPTTGVISADTTKGTNSLATYSQLASSFDTIHVVPYITTGVTLLRFTNDSLRPKSLIAGTNITLTQNNDSSVTISSSGGGISTDSAVFAGLGITKSISGTNITLNADTSYLVTKGSAQTISGNKIVSGTLSLTNNILSNKPNVVSIDTTTGQLYHANAQFVDTTGKVNGYVVTWNSTAGNFVVSAPTSGGSTNSNVGTGYRVAVSGTNNIKTLFAGSNITLDSTSNTNGITITASGSGGTTTLTNNGSGFRLVQPLSGSNYPIRTLFVGSGLTIDSTTNTNGLTLTNTGITSITGTTNQITASTTSGVTTLSLPSTVSITNLTTSGTNTLNGVTYTTSAVSPKADVIMQDTTTGILYRNSAQYVDTTSATTGKIVYWNGANFALQTNYTTGSSTQSGTGVATSFTIAHGLAGISSTSTIIVTPRTSAASGIAYVTTDGTNINIFYSTAPPSGSSNLTWSYIIKP